MGEDEQWWHHTSKCLAIVGNSRRLPRSNRCSLWPPLEDHLRPPYCMPRNKSERGANIFQIKDDSPGGKEVEHRQPQHVKAMGREPPPRPAPSACCFRWHETNLANFFWRVNGGLTPAWTFINHRQSVPSIGNRNTGGFGEWKKQKEKITLCHGTIFSQLDGTTWSPSPWVEFVFEYYYSGGTKV